MRLSNLKIGTRLALVFCMVILFTIISSVMAWRGLNNVGARWQEFSNVSMEKREFITTGYIKLGSAIHNFKDYVLRGRDYDKKFIQDLAAIDSAMQGYVKTGVLNERETLLLDDISKNSGRYRLALDKAVAMKSSGKSIEEIDSGIAGADKALGTALDGLMVMARDNTTAAGKSIAATVDSVETLIIGMTVAVTLFSFVCSRLVTRSITGPIHRAVVIAQTVAAGDLSQAIEVNSTDEVGQLLSALKDMTDSLQEIVVQVRSGTDTIATASGQIAAGSLDLSSRTEEQATALEETASSMEEMTGTIRQNADNARQASQFAQSASDIAINSGAVVSQMIDTMGSVSASSRKIVDIIAVIDGIAFQTNILALNAAVEAARAGEQGRGFAVVASEVRNLAQRSAAAAKDIKTLISESVHQVDAGSKLVNQAGNTMNEVVTSVRHVSEIIGEITAAGVEQTAGIEQINQAIMQMDQATQQNAALVEESAAAAQSMSEQSEILLRLVRIFKLREDAAPLTASSRSTLSLSLSRTPA